MLDPAFTLLPPSALGAVTRVAMQPDGKFIVASPIRRLNSDGTLDISFFSDLLGLNITAIALGADGSVVAAGSFYPPPYVGERPLGPLVRLNSSGIRDSTFQPPYATTSIDVVQIQPDGKVLVGGFLDAYRHAVGRFTREGSPDPAFTSDSVVGPIWAMALQPDGRILIGGSFQVSSGQTRSLVRLQSTGAIDTSFNAAFNTDVTISALALQPDGNVLAIAGDRIVRVIGINGNIDSSFRAELGTKSRFANLTLQPDGKVLVLGEIFSAADDLLGRIVRLNGNGSLDSSFSSPIGELFVLWSHGHVFTSEDCRLVRLLPQTPLASFWLQAQAGVHPEDGTKPPVITVLRGGNSSSNVSVDFSTTGDAIAGIDFVPGSGTVSFQPLETSKDIVFQLIDNCRVDPNKIFEVTLTNPPANALVSYPDRATVEILDDDAPGSLGDLNPAWYTHALALQPDGTIVVGGPQGIARLNEDGSLDSSFSPAPSICGGYYYDGECAAWTAFCDVASVLIQPDGKIVAGGFGQVIRLKPNGEWDTGSDAFVNWYNSCPTGVDSAPVKSVLLQPDGKIITLSGPGGSSCYEMVRLNQDLTADTN